MDYSSPITGLTYGECFVLQNHPPTVFLKKGGAGKNTSQTLRIELLENKLNNIRHYGILE